MPPAGQKGYSNTQLNVSWNSVEMAYAALPMGLAFNFINGFILVALLYSVVDFLTLAIWYGSLVVVNVARISQYMIFKKQHIVAHSLQYWAKWFLAGSIASGLVWACAAFALYADDALVYQVFLAFVLAGMGGGAVASLAPILPAALCFVSLVMLPLGMQFFAGGDALHIIMGFLIFAMAGTYVVNAKRMHASIIENSRLLEEAENREEALCRHQQQLRHSSLMTRVGSWEMDVETYEFNWSDEAREIYGLTKDDHPTLSEVLGHFKPEAQRILEHSISNAIKFGDIISLELPFVNEQAVEGWVKILGEVELDSNHSRRVFGAFQDIAEAKKVELESIAYQKKLEEQADVLEQFTIDLECKNDELAAAWGKAEEASKAKTDFLASMSHEIRTPLNSIVGFTKVLLRKAEGEKTLQGLGLIKGASDHLLGIVNDILDVARMEEGKLTLDTTEYDLVDELKELSRMFGVAAYESGVELIFSIDPTLPRTLEGDPLRVRQVFANLISNAIKFTESGYIRCSVGWERRSDGLLLLRASVEDSGIGMDEAQANLLFSAFTQADSSTARKYGGTGLGLNISKKLVEIMGGEIHFTSELGEGTEFQFSWLSRDISSQLEESPLEVIGKRFGSAVLVSDSEQFIKQIEAICTVLSIEITTLSKLEEVFDKININAEEIAEDFILVDCGVASKSLNAFENLAHKVGLSSNLPIILLTHFCDDELNEKAAALGVEYLISKPVFLDELSDCINTILASESILSGQSIGSRFDDRPHLDQ